MNNILDFNTNPGDKERIKEMARRYFNRNPRLVKSFVRDLAFLLSVIKPRYDFLVGGDNLTPELEQEKKNLAEIVHNPGLLAKIIVVRERFPDEFKEIQKNPTIISELEDNPGFDINTLRVEQGDGHEKFFDQELKTFINSWPLFKQRAANPANFILLGGSSGTEFQDEIDVGQFVNYANAGDAENFYQAISKSPPYKRAEYLTSVINAHESSEAEVKQNIEKSALGTIYLVENMDEKNVLLEKIIPWAEKESGVIFNNLDVEQIKRWIRALDKSSYESDQLSKIMSETPYGNSDAATRNRFLEAFTLPNLSESMVGKFSIFLSSLLNSFPEKQFILDLLSREDFASRISKNPEKINVGNNISTFCIVQTYSEEKNKSINLLNQITPDEDNRKLLIEHLISWLSSTDENQKNFAKQHLMQFNLWPDNKDKLKIVANKFMEYYKNVSPEEKNTYNGLIQFLNGKEVLKVERKSTARTK